VILQISVDTVWNLACAWDQRTAKSLWCSPASLTRTQRRRHLSAYIHNSTLSNICQRAQRV